MTAETVNVAHWALVHNGATGRKWYHVARVVRVDGKWWELNWHPDTQLRGPSMRAVRDRAMEEGIPLIKGVFGPSSSRREGPELVWSFGYGRD